VDETSSGTEEWADAEPEVTHVVDGGVAQVTLTGELTEAARRPLVRVLTDLLLERHHLGRVELYLAAVSFMNSAGMAVLVQLQRMAAPRGVEVVLVDPPVAVVRPLQLSGLWHRFPIVGEVSGAPEDAGRTE
jgi:stage II sporulation protein AA (anti-sigma F factor antagonist)